MLRLFGIWPLLVLGAASPALAQPALTLAEAIARARAQSPDSEAAAAGAREAAEHVTQARAAFLPRIDVTESWQRSDQPVFVFSSLLSQRRFTSANFAINALNHPDAIDNFRTAIVAEQSLFDGTTRSAVATATIAQQIAQARRTQVRQDLAVAVTDTFGRVLTAIEAKKSAAAAVESARADRERAVNRRDAGLATDADVLTIDVFAARAQEQEIRTAADERTARAELNALIGESLTAVLVLERPTSPTTIDTSDLEALQAEALAHRPDVAIAALEERLGTAAVEAARGAYLPSVSAQGGWEFNGGAWNDRTSSWMVGAFARINLFRGLADKAGLAAARDQLVRRSHERRKAEDTARLDVFAAAARLDAARARAAVGRAAVAQARESRRIIRDRYDTGLAEVTALLRASESVVQAEAQQVSAEVAVLIATAALERALGRQ